MQVAAITGVHSTSFCLFEISFLLTSGGSLISLCEKKHLFQQEILSAKEKMVSNTHEIFCLRAASG